MHAPSPASPPPLESRLECLWGAIVVFLGAVAVTLSLWAVHHKSSTFDEPLHTLAAAVSHQPNGLLLNPEHPPLWKYYAHLATGHLPVQLPPAVIEQLTKGPDAQWFVTWREMYQQPAARGQPLAGEALVARARVLMALVLLPVGLLTYLLARMVMQCWLLAPAAARPLSLAAAAMVLFDPNTLAHAPLVTNDLFMVMWTLAVACLLLKYHQPGELRIAWLAAAATCVGLALATKFSAVALLAAAIIVVVVSAARTGNWKQGLAGLAILTLVPYTVVWAVYGFTYSPTPDPTIAFDLPAAADRVSLNRRLAAMEKSGTTAPHPPPPPDTLTKAILTLDAHHLLPQPYLHGLMTSYGLTRFNNGYLLGEVRGTGWPWYFPIAWAVKTPLGVIALTLAGLLALPAGAAKRWPSATWPAITVAASYVLFAVSTPLNIGFRHFFPVLPFFVVLAISCVACAGVIHKTQRWSILLVWGCFVAIAIELHTTFPHWISFFNSPAKHYGPAKLLSDSNLDWGQDLTLLADWRRQNPQGTLYLAYFGTADPQLTYGLNYINLHGGYEFGPPPGYPQQDQPGYLAISTTALQGTYANKDLRAFYQTVSQHTPVAVVGSTIRIFNWPFPDNPDPHTQQRPIK